MKKLLKRILWILLLAVLVFVVIYVWPRVPIITAFAAKGMCSSVFLADKDPERVYAEDLSFFPISLAKCEIDYGEKTVTAKVFGLAKRKAVYREGLGAVLVLDIPEEELKKSTFEIPEPSFSQDTVPWPMGDVVKEEVIEGLKYDLLREAVESAFDPSGEEANLKTLSMAVVYDGKMVAEKYLDGYDHQTMFHGWSMTKSLTAPLVGILIKEGKMDIKRPVGFPEWSEDERASITLENLLHMSSGLEWLENYFTISEATIMLMQSSNMFDFVKQLPLVHQPGEYYYYSSGDANLVSGLIRQTLADDHRYHSLPYESLLHKIGMHNTIIETDGSGNFVSSSYSYGTTRDWARYGLFCLNNGVFVGDTILPPGWMEFCRKEAPAANTAGKYGGLFWLDHPLPGQSYESLPGDLYMARGFLGQRIFIIPSESLVVVRMGFSSKNLDEEKLLKDIISALPD